MVEDGGDPGFSRQAAAQLEILANVLYVIEHSFPAPDPELLKLANEALVRLSEHLFPRH